MKIFRKKWRGTGIAASLPWLAVLAALAGGCAAPEVTDTGLQEEPDALHLRLSIETDEYTRAGLTPDYDVSAAERRIDDVLVMLFEQNADGSLGSLVMSKTAENLTSEAGEGGSRRFDVKLSLSGNGSIPARMRVVTLANGAHLASKVAAMKGNAYSVIRADESLWRAEKAADGSPLFTMWGSAKDPVEKSQRVQNIRMSMLRDMAKVSVTLAKDDEGNSAVTGDPGFKLAYALVYNRRGEAAMLPDLACLDHHDGSGTGLDPYGVRKPTVRKDAAGNTLLTGLMKDEGYEDAISPAGLETVSIYVPEQDILMGGTGKVDDGNTMQRPAIIIGGYAGGDTGKLTWYRVDFTGDKDSDGTPLLTDVMRNHHYRVNVKAVNGPGEDTPGEAYETQQAKVETDIVDWTDVEWDAEFDGSNWIAAQREVTVGASEGDVAGLILRSNVDSAGWTFTWDKDSEGFFEASVEADESDDSEQSDKSVRTRVVIKALQDLPTDTESRTAVLTVTVTPKLRFVINVIQTRSESSGDTDDQHDPWKDDDLNWIFQ